MSDLVTIETFTSPWDAHIARGLLESEGIASFVFDEHYVGMEWPMSQALGGVKLKVPVSDVERARVVLRELKEGRYEAALDEELALERPTCQRCGSIELELFRSGASRLLTFIAGFLTSTPFPPPISGQRSRKCGHDTADPS